MSQVTGTYFDTGIFVLNPLRVGGPGIDILLHFLDKDLPFWVDAMPMMGVTAPVTWAGALAVTAASLLAGFTCLKALDEEKPVTLSTMLYPFDSRKGGIVFEPFWEHP